MWATSSSTLPKTRPLLQGEDEESQQSEEAYLYSLRSVYNRAIGLQYSSSEVGDQDWNVCKASLEKLGRELSEVLSNTSFSSVLLQECKRLLFLVHKNASRLQSRESSEGHWSAAYLAALAASSLIADGGGLVDSGLVLRTAKLALKMGDVWLCNLLISYHKDFLSDLYEQAVVQLEQYLITKEKEEFAALDCADNWARDCEWTPSESTKPGNPPPLGQLPSLESAKRAFILAATSMAQQPLGVLHGTDDGLLAVVFDSPTGESQLPIPHHDTVPSFPGGGPPPFVSVEDSSSAQNADLRRSSRQPVRKFRDDDEYPSTTNGVGAAFVVSTSVTSPALVFRSAVQEALFPMGLTTTGDRPRAKPQDMLDSFSSEIPNGTYGRSSVAGVDDAISYNSRLAVANFISILKAGCSHDTKNLEFILLCALLVDDICKGAKTFSKEDLAFLSLAIMKCWYALLQTRNYDYESCFSLLKDFERIFVCECAADALRNFQQYALNAKEEEVLIQIAKNTLYDFFFNWPFEIRKLISEISHDGKKLLATRYIWLFLTHTVVGTSNSDGISIVDDVGCLLTHLKDFLARHGPLTLMHCRVWGELDIKHVGILSAFFQDSFFLADVEKRRAPTHEWLSMVRDALTQQDNLLGLITSTVNRQQNPDESLISQICKVCVALDDARTWVFTVTRVISALPTLFMMRSTQASDGGVISWAADMIESIASSQPLTSTNIPEEELNELFKLASSFLLFSYVRNHEGAFDASTTFLTALMRWTGSIYGLSRCISSCVACVDDTTTMETSLLLSAVCSFLTNLTRMGAFSANAVDESTRLTFARSFLFHFDRWESVNSSAQLSSMSSLLSCCMSTSSIPCSQKLFSAKCFVDCYIAGKFISIDNGKMLAYFASVWQQLVNDPNQSTPFPLFDLSGREQLEFTTALGQCYALLYSFPLVPMSTELTVGERSFVIISPELADDLFRFYKYAVSVGRGSRAERRACLTMLTELPAFDMFPDLTPNLKALDAFLFSGSSDVDATLFISQLGTESAQFKSQVVAHSSIYYELLCLVREGSSSTHREGDAALLVTEKRILKSIELCTLDLSFSPLRIDTWVTLHCKLIEYLNIVCDEIGSACIPGLLPKQLLEFHSETITLSGLCDAGTLRYDFIRGEMLRKLFETENGNITARGKVPGAVKDAWGLPSDVQISRLFLHADLRSTLLRAILRVNSLLLCDDNFLHAGKEIIQCFLSQGLTYLTMSYEANGDAHIVREFQTLALTSIERALTLSSESVGGEVHRLNDASVVYLLCIIARIRWELYGDVIGSLASISQARNVFNKEKEAGGRPLWKNLRLGVLNELSSLLIDISIQLFSSTEEDDSKGNAVVEAATHLSCLQSSEASVPSDLWDVVFSCLHNLRECQRLDPQDFRPIYNIALSLHRLANSHIFIPQEISDRLLSLQITQVDDDGALHELQKLFDKKRPQIFAIWVPDKPNDTWDCQLRRIYEFENQRRAVFSLFVELVDACDDLQASLTVLHNCFTSKNQTATVRFMIDASVSTVANIVGKNFAKYQEELVTVYHILALMHSYLASNTSKKLTKVLCALYSRNVSDGVAVVNLKQVTRYCKEKFGDPQPAMPVFHRRQPLSELGKRKPE